MASSSWLAVIAIFFKVPKISVNCNLINAHLFFKTY